MFLLDVEMGLLLPFWFSQELGSIWHRYHVRLNVASPCLPARVHHNDPSAPENLFSPYFHYVQDGRKKSNRLDGKNGRHGYCVWFCQGAAGCWPFVNRLLIERILIPSFMPVLPFTYCRQKKLAQKASSTLYCRVVTRCIQQVLNLLVFHFIYLNAERIHWPVSVSVAWKRRPFLGRLYVLLASVCISKGPTTSK